jgi:DNA ligase (NAD+)
MISFPPHGLSGDDLTQWYCDNADAILKDHSTDDPTIESVTLLTGLVAAANTRYRNHQESPLADSVYDALVKKLGVSDDLQLTKVGDASIRHLVQMPSLRKLYSLDRGLYHRSRSWYIDPKIDGVAISIHYLEGKLFMAALSGNGVVGDLITARILNIPFVPNEISTSHPMSHIEIRGEIYVTHGSLTAINKLIANIDGVDPYKNNRSAAAGMINTIDNDHFKPYLSFAAWDMIIHQGFDPYHTRGSKMSALAEMGFIIPPLAVTATISDEVDEIVSELVTTRSKIWDLGIPIDGFVFKPNSSREYEYSPITSETDVPMKYHPVAFAYKLPNEWEESKVYGVDYQLGRTGVVTPVYRIAPVIIDGTTISSATGHNVYHMEGLGIGPNSEVTVARAGGVIPAIRTVRTSPDGPFPIPTDCPSCGKPLVRLERKLLCREFDCKDKFYSYLTYIVSKECLNIPGYGEVWARSVVDDSITLNQPLTGSRVADLILGNNFRSSTPVLSLDKMRGPSFTCREIVLALNIPNVGVVAADKITSLVNGDTYSIVSYLTEQPETLERAGIPIHARESIAEYFQEGSKTRVWAEAFILRLSELGAIEIMKPIQRTMGPGVVVTGKFSDGTRDTIKELIQSMGYSVTKNVNPATKFLLAGEDPSQKKIKVAKDLGVTIINDGGGSYKDALANWVKDVGNWRTSSLLSLIE